MRPRIVSPRTSKHSFRGGTTDCHHPNCCLHLGRMFISYETHWHVISPKYCTSGNYARAQEWEQTWFWHYCFSVVQRVHRFQGWCFICHIPNIESTRGRTLKLKTRSLWSQYVIPHSCGSPHINTVVTHKFDTTNWHHMTNAINWKLIVRDPAFHSQSNGHFVSYIMALFWVHWSFRFVYATMTVKNISIP